MAEQLREKIFCVLEYAKTSSVISVQRHFRTKFGKEAPHRNNIRRWVEKFAETGSLLKGKSTGRPNVSNEVVENIRVAYQRSPRKSTRRASRELNVPRTTVWRVLRKRLQFKPYKFQMVQALKPADLPKRTQFCQELQLRLEEDGFEDRLVFTDEATFHLSGKVNRHNLRFWGTENPQLTLEYERDSPKLNVFCAITSNRVFGPFFFAEPTVTGGIYLDMLSEWLLPQLTENVADFILQQDWSGHVRDHLNMYLPQRWIGRAGLNDVPLMLWPPRSPDLTPCDFFLWGYVKDKVYIPPLPRDLRQLRQRINDAVDTIDHDMLGRVWQELDYRADVCRVTRGAHIEHL